MLHSRWYSLLLILLIGFVHPSYSQPADSTDHAVNNSLRDGNWALQFGVEDGLFDLTGFLGSTLSVKVHVADTRAWQFGIMLETAFRETTTEGEADTEANRQSVALTARYIVYPRLKDHAESTVHLYYGAGPRVALNRTHSEGFRNAEDIDTDMSWVAGLSGVVGAEWFVHPRISLLGEYNSSLLYRHGRSTSEAAGQPERTRNSIILRPQGVRLGVSAYF